MTKQKRIILGIDPGSRSTGFGVIWSRGQNCGVIDYGNIQTSGTDLCQRLGQIHNKLLAIIEKHQPHEAAIEQVFTCRNPQSALKLGQARGAALVATAKYVLPTHEYSARQVKQAVVGYGAASKTQMQHMVKILLNLITSPQVDAADALAIALCHANTQLTQNKLLNV